MKYFKLEIPCNKPEYDFTIVYKGKDGIIEIKTSKDILLQKLQYFNQKRNELYQIDEYYIHDKYKTDIFRNFIESIKNSEIIINEKNCLEYYELSSKYGYQELYQVIDKFNKERPDIQEIVDQLYTIKQNDSTVDNCETETADTFHKEEIIAQNLDIAIRNGFLKKLPTKNIIRILNSPKRQIIDHHILFDFVIDQIKNHNENKTESINDIDYISSLTTSLDYTKMNASEIEEFLSLGQDLSIFHPSNHEKRMKEFIEESKEHQLKIAELEKILKKIILKEEENEKKISEIEQNLSKSQESTDKKISEIEQNLSKSQESTDKKISEIEQNLSKSQESTDKKISEIEQNLSKSQDDIINEMISEKQNIENNKQKINEIQNRIEKEIQIKIELLQCLTSKTIYVNPTDLIKDIISKYIGCIDEYYVSYKKVFLNPDFTLNYYHIPDHSVLYLIKITHLLDEDEFPVFIKLNSQDYIMTFAYSKMKIYIFNRYFNQYFHFYDKLIYNDKELKDDKTIQDYLITCGSVISLSKPKLKITVNYLFNNRGSETEFVDITSTIGQIFGDYIVFFNGERLDSSKKISDYSIKEGSEFFVDCEIPEKYDIKIDALNLKISLPIYSRIKDVKLEIEKRKGIPCNEQLLFNKQYKLFNDNLILQMIEFKELNEIDFYHLPKGSKYIIAKFNIIHSLGAYNHDYIKYFNQKRIIILKDNLLIKEMLSKLKEEYKYYNFTIIYNNQILDDEKMLQDYISPLESGKEYSFDYKAQHHSFNEEHMTIILRCSSGKSYFLDVTPSYTIEEVDLDMKIKGFINPERYYRYIFTGRMIEQGDTLKDYSVKKDSTIHVIDRYCRYPFPIYLNILLTGKIIHIDVERDDFIRDIKLKVHKIVGIPPYQQRILFAGNFYDDSTQLSKTCIQRDCMLHVAYNFE